MSELEKTTQDHSAKKYIATARDEAGLKAKYSTPPAEERAIDEETERTLVSVISAAIVAVPAAILLGKMLPDIPIYNIYQYFNF
ncbi:hypothetical protein KY338_04165 [Candidatus Woesearchaeota archaeon]|nr:hypothetical protein [Candidatus Woesearchaeota archaeon]MBW3005824.1 hypothetical protein [Candidatus Woesearchaeota archaeon]